MTSVGGLIEPSVTSMGGFILVTSMRNETERKAKLMQEVK